MKNYAVKITTALVIVLAFAIEASAKICISNISISGNKITKNITILREIPIKIGTYVSLQGLEHKIRQSEENLENTSLFNDIIITYTPDTTTAISTRNFLRESIYKKQGDVVDEDLEFYTLNIYVTERWYYWPLVGVKLETRNLSSWLKDMDFNKITFDLGAKIDNVWGLNHTLQLSGKFGFEQGVRFSYEDINLDPKGIHSLNVLAYSFFNKTINSHSADNKQFYNKGEKYLEKSTGGVLSYIYRPEIRVRHKVYLEYNYRRVTDSVLIYNPDYYGTSALKNHEYSLMYKFSFDYRNYVVYPTKGYYIGATAKGSTSDNFNFWYGNVVADVQYYHQISKRWFWKTALQLSTSFKNRNAYIYDKAIGYDAATVCGYDLYVVDGQHYGVFNNSLRFLVLPKKVIQLNFLRALSKFNKIPFTIYLSASVDMGYAYNKYKIPSNNLQNQYLLGAGISLDILTYYDIIVNVSYAYTRMKEGGFFFGLKTPIF